MALVNNRIVKDGYFDFLSVGHLSILGGSSQPTLVTRLPATFNTPGFYLLSKDLTLPTSSTSRNAITVTSDNVCISLGCHALTLDFAPSGLSQDIQTSGIFVGNHKNVFIGAGTIRGIAQPENSLRTDWFGIRSASSHSIVVRDVHFENLRVGIKNDTGTLAAPQDNSMHEISNCTFRDCVGRDEAHGTLTVASGPAAGVYLLKEFSVNNVAPLPLTRPIVAANPLDASAPLINAAAINGNIALVIRGGVGFQTKINNAIAAGAAAIIIYNNVTLNFGHFNITSTTIPAFFASQSTGTTLLANLPLTGTLAVGGDRPFNYWDNWGGAYRAPQIRGVSFTENKVEQTFHQDPFNWATIAFFLSGSFDLPSPIGLQEGITQAINVLECEFIRTNPTIYIDSGGNKQCCCIIEDCKFLLFPSEPGYPLIFMPTNDANSEGQSFIMRGCSVAFSDNSASVPTGTCLFCPGSRSLIVEDCAFNAPAAWGELAILGWFVGGGSFARSTVMRRCVLSGTPTNHVLIFEGETIVVEDNIFDQSTRAVEATSFGGPADVTIRNNHIEHATSHGILLNGGVNSAILDGNTLKNNNVAVEISVGCNDTLVIRNVFNTNTTNLIDNGAGTVIPVGTNGSNINGP